jgi:hypothetical protein
MLDVLPRPAFDIMSIATRDKTETYDIAKAAESYKQRQDFHPQPRAKYTTEEENCN